MAAPTPATKVFWDGTRGAARYYVAWTVGAPDNLTDSVVVDVSALSPVPSRNAVKVRSIILSMNGNFTATLEYDDVATGVVNTATAGNAVTWVSGDKFKTGWLTEGFGGLTINGTEYALATLPSTTSATVSSDPGNQTAVAYTYDETIDRFVGQADETFEFQREYFDGPNSGLTPDQSSSSFVGDITLTTAGVAASDELAIYLIFEK